MALRIPSNLPDDLETLIHEVIGAAIEVHRHLGPGYLESIYEEALCYELDLRKIPYERQKSLVVRYKDKEIPGQRVDLIAKGQLILELKALDAVPPIHEAKLLSYMRTTGIRAGLVINFNVPLLKDGVTRMVL